MRPSPAARPRSRGFTLVEVVVAMGLIAMGVMAVFGVLAAGRNFERSAREDALAARLASQLEAELVLPGVWRRRAGAPTALGDGQARVLEGALPLDPQGFGSAEAPLVIGFGVDDRPLWLLGGDSWEGGSRAEGVQALVGLWGRRNGRGVVEVELSVELPARARREDRRRYRYRMQFNPEGR